MSDQRRFRWKSGRLASGPIQDFWQISTTAQDPGIPNLPLETEAAAGGDHQIAFTGIPSASAVGAFSVNGTIAPAGVPSSAAVGAFSVNGSIAFAGIPSASQVGVPEVRAQLTLVGVPSASAAGAFGVNGTIAFVGVPSASAVGSFSVNGTIAPVGVPSSAACGRPTIGQEEPGEQPQQSEAPSAGSHLVVYASMAPWVVPDEHPIKLVGVPSSAAVGKPTVGRVRLASRRRREEYDLMRLAA